MVVYHLKNNISESGILQGSTITGSSRFEDQFGNVGSGSFSVNVYKQFTINNFICCKQVFLPKT